MGNNHDKYFGKEKRKILILGLPDSGKTCNSKSI
jgi:GTPase SAR1 family protein